MKKTISIFGLFAVAAAAAALFVACAKDGGNAPVSSDGGGGGEGQGGSMARFTIVGDYLYTVNSKTLTVLSVADPAQPTNLTDLDIGSWDIETIYPMSRDGKNYLFIGSRSAMYIYDITNPEFPQQLPATGHFVSNDPVVAYGNAAFVTLSAIVNSNGTTSGRDALQIYDISNITNARLMRTVNDVRRPRGLAVDGPAGMLFVCENRGVSAWEYTYHPAVDDTPSSVDIGGLYRSGQIPAVSSIDAYDCIVLDGYTNGGTGRLLVVGADGLYQLGYDRGGRDGDGFTLISKIDLRREE
jgi:hypothetical protein